MAECIHAIPGRVRYRIPALRHSPTIAEALHTRLADSPGIRQVEIKRQAASLIVHFDPATLETDALHHLVMGHVPSAPQVSVTSDSQPSLNTAPCRTRQAIRYVSGLAGAAALNALLERAVKAGIGAVLRSARIPI